MKGCFGSDVVENHFDEGVAFEIAAYMLEVVAPVAVGRGVEPESDACHRREFLAGIVVEHAVKFHHAVAPAAGYEGYVGGGQFAAFLSPPAAEVFNHPRPFKVIIIFAHEAQTFVHGFERVD